MPPATLAGRTVLELGTFLAAPFAANILAELGADVIKIESLTGDPTRSIGKAGGLNGTFAAYSRGKRSLSLDLRTPEGREVLDRLIAKADIVLHNLAPDSMRRLKLTYDDCSRINPNVVYCHISGYGPGPRENELASNPIAEAATGVMYAHRVNGRPMRLGPSYHDQFAGAYAVIGILGALSTKDSTKESRCVEIGLYEVSLHVAARELANVQLRAISGAPQTGADSGEFSFAGYGAYETEDHRWIYLVMLTDLHWENFCEALSAPEGNDPLLKTSQQRKERRQQAEAIVVNAVRAKQYEEVATRLTAVNFGFTEIKPPAEVLDDPQAQQPGKAIGVPYQGHTLRIPNFPLATRKLDTPAPALGEHSVEILRSLGYDREECDALVKGGAVRAT